MIQHHIKHHTPHQTHQSLWFRGTRRPCGCFCLILLNSPLLDKHIHTRRSTHPSQLVAFENITFCLYMPTPLAAHTRMHAHTQIRILHARSLAELNFRRLLSCSEHLTASLSQESTGEFTHQAKLQQVTYECAKFLSSYNGVADCLFH
jgi:hypothetical protein